MKLIARDWTLKLEFLLLVAVLVNGLKNLHKCLHQIVEVPEHHKHPQNRLHCTRRQSWTDIHFPEDMEDGDDRVIHCNLCHREQCNESTSWMECCSQSIECGHTVKLELMAQKDQQHLIRNGQSTKKVNHCHKSHKAGPYPFFLVLGEVVVSQSNAYQSWLLHVGRLKSDKDLL